MDFYTPQPAPPGGRSAVTPPERYPKRRALGRDLALAGALLCFFILFWDAAAWARGTGLGEALGLAGVLPAALLYLRGRTGRLGGYGLVCAAVCLLGALSLAFSGDETLKLLTVLALPLLFVVVILERLELRTGRTLLSRLCDLLYTGFGMSFGRLNVGFWALSHSGKEDSAQTKKVRAAGIGLLCAIPALLVLVPLLICSDAAFAGLVSRLDWDAVGRGLSALLLGAFTALLLFCLLFTSDRGPKSVRVKERKGAEPAAAAAFLIAVSAAYVLYLVAQFAYFTDAFRGLLPKDFTVAEYARRGFFETWIIVAINLGLIVTALALCRKDSGKVPAAVKAPALFLCLVSMGLAAAALAKMILYMHSFGLTRLRILTSAFLLYLAAIAAAVGLRLFFRRVPVIGLAVTLGAAALIALSLANVDGIVARYNTEAWRTGKLESLDVETVCRLGDGAAPCLLELSRCEDERVALRVQRELNNRLVAAGMAEYRTGSLVLTGGGADLRSWNVIGAQARTALEQYAAEYAIRHPG